MIDLKPRTAGWGWKGEGQRRQQAAEHRAAMVDAASRLFRERGFDGVGVAEITRRRG